MNNRYLIIAGITVTIACHGVAIGQQTKATRTAIGPYWSGYANGVQGKYSTAQAACDARAALINWSPLKYTALSDHMGNCVDSSGRAMGWSFFGQHCPKYYSMTNYVEYSQSWFVEDGIYYGIYYGPNQYCESSGLVVDRWHDKSQDQCTKFGNPIYPLSGAKQQPQTLLQWSPFAPVLSVTFDSRRKLPNSDTDPRAVFSPIAAPSFGGLWESSMHKRLVSQYAGYSGIGYFRIYQASRGAGNWVTFSRASSSDSAKPDSDVNDRLVTLSSGWRYIDARSQAQEEYDSAGALRSTTRARGGRLLYSYSDSATAPSVAPAPGLLIKIEDPFGRAMQFEYEQPAGAITPRVSRIIDPDGLATEVGYDASGNMSRLTWPDNTVRRFLYEQSGLPWALTGIVDENNERHSTYAYDQEGRALSTEYAGGSNRYSLTYGVPPRWVTTETFDSSNQMFWRDHYWTLPQDVGVKAPNGAVLSLGASLVQGSPRVTSRSQPAGAGCDASSSSLTYDSSGNVASKTDFNGTKSCHAYDLSRNLETARIDGLGAADACPADIGAFPITAEASQRRTTTQWHPAWSRPIKQAEPSKIITSVYNGQPDPTSGNATASCAPTTAVLPDGSPIAVLCKKVEQATTDATGGLGFNATVAGTPRTWTYTYNQYGQVLTARDPLSKLTTYAYYSDTTDQHTMGDLQSVTDSAGRVTQYTRYDKSGRLLQSIDANGIVTDTTYTLRGWVKTVTVAAPGTAAQASLYDYDGAGQLKKATLPDGSALEYTYDAAHRLTSIKDAAGNSVTYTLDNMGNRTGEDLKDPSGTLARNITRVYDALNRAQSSTGMAQ